MDADGWVLIDGGVCLFGDDARPVPVRPLCWTITPVTPGTWDNAAPGRTSR